MKKRATEKKIYRKPQHGIKIKIKAKKNEERILFSPLPLGWNQRQNDLFCIFQQIPRNLIFYL